MSDLVICRICLRTDTKSYHYDQFNLKYYYEQITACKVNERELLPRWFCFECAALLYKYNKFRQKCYTGQSILREIAWNGMLSYEAISKVDRDGRELQSPLTITQSDDGKTFTNILSPSVPYKKRSNIKIEHIANEAAKLTNTFQQLVDAAEQASSSQNEDVDLEDMIESNMNEPSGSDIKTESINVDMDMMAAGPIPPPLPPRLEPVPVTDHPHTYNPSYIEPLNFHSSHSIFGHGIQHEPEAVWIPDINDTTTATPQTTNTEEKKSWTNKSSFLDPANWKRTMLTEEQAIEKFHKRAIDPKYVNARFKCTECFSNFAREEMLRKHILINHVESVGSHICRFCKRRFHKACKLRLHMKRHYVQIECLRCNMLFWGEGLAFQHEEFHRGVTTTCKYCNHQFRHKSTYYQHLRTHHRSSHVCPACGASFVSKAGLNVHKRRLHALEKDVPKEPDANIYCKRCDMKFVTIMAYQEHYRHSALHAEGMDMPMNEEIRGPNMPPRQPYVRCTVCNEQFYTYQACMKHHRHHHPAIPFMKKSVSYAGKSNERVNCELCGALIKCNEQFYTYQACMKHHRHHHPAIPFMKKSVSYAGKSNERVNCELCGALIKVTSLYTHMNAHTRTKVYTCEICEMQFNYPTSLLRHRVTHTGEKKYPCPLCEKRFTQRNSMQLHYRTFHLKEPYPKRNRQKKKPPPGPEVNVNVTSLMS